MCKLKVIFEGSSYDDLNTWPIKIKAPFALSIESLSYHQKTVLAIKSLNGLGNGVCELIKNGKIAYRVVFVIKNGCIHILHAFTKSSFELKKKHESTIKLRYSRI